MVVLRQGGASYWVVNTLRDELSNETMIAIAKGLQPSRASRLRPWQRSECSAPATSAS